MCFLSPAFLVTLTLLANLVSSSPNAVGIKRRTGENDTATLSTPTYLWPIPTKDQSSSTEIPVNVPSKDAVISVTIPLKDQTSTSAPGETTTLVPASSTFGPDKDHTSTSSALVKESSATISTTLAKGSNSVSSVPANDLTTSATTISKDSNKSLAASVIVYTPPSAIITPTSAVSSKIDSTVLALSTESPVSSKSDLPSATIGRIPIGPLLGHTSSLIESTSNASLSSTFLYTLSALETTSSMARIPIGPLMGHTSSPLASASQSNESLTSTLFYSLSAQDSSSTTLNLSPGPSSPPILSTETFVLSSPSATASIDSSAKESESSKLTGTAQQVTSVRVFTVTGTPRVVVNGSSTVIPLYTPGILGNAYGGGYITMPSIYVTITPSPVVGVPPGYGFSLTPEGSTILVSIPAASTSSSVTREIPDKPQGTGIDVPTVGPASSASASGNQTFSAPVQPSSPAIFQGSASKESALLVTAILGLLATVLLVIL
ncbi:hypothetical protein MMC13_005756 [Lambiella insularis]|nr:hypothetical protein [Lambiella insularis]